MGHTRTQTLEELQQSLEHYQSRKYHIERNKTGDVFCDVCLQAVPADKLFTDCCEAKWLTKTEAVKRAYDLIQLYSTDVRREKARPMLQHRSAGTAPVDPEMAITIIFSDQTQQSYPSAKKARKALRDKGLSVNDATKEGNTWRF